MKFNNSANTFLVDKFLPKKVMCVKRAWRTKFGKKNGPTDNTFSNIVENFHTFEYMVK